MRLLVRLAGGLLCGCLAAGQDAPKAHVRFFNDSTKAAKFYVDGQFSCSIPANPQGNLAYCDAETPLGKHTVAVDGAKLQHQSCDLYAGLRGAEVHLPKGEHLNCVSILNE